MVLFTIQDISIYHFNPVQVKTCDVQFNVDGGAFIRASDTKRVTIVQWVQ